MARILIIGGYGAFGIRAAERLAWRGDHEIIVAGRSAARAAEEAARLSLTTSAPVRHARLDARRASLRADLSALAPSVTINASGPFQDQDYSVAEACIAAGCHYIDLADAREFVVGIGALDGAARAAGCLVVAGASSVPGLSSAVVAAQAPRFQKIRRLDIGISPGNRFDPGVATAASVIGGAGRPMTMPIGGEMRRVYGWQSTRRHTFPGLGRRWMGNVDVPDLALFPSHYPALETVRFQAGLEVGLFHLSLWGLSWLVRAGLATRPQRLAPGLIALKRRLSFLGSDRGGMFVTLSGLDADRRPLGITWTLVADSGHGPYVPAIPATILARRLADGREALRGAMPCFGLITLGEFMAEVRDLDITTSVKMP